LSQATHAHVRAVFRKRHTFDTSSKYFSKDVPFLLKLDLIAAGQSGINTTYPPSFNHLKTLENPSIDQSEAFMETTGTKNHVALPRFLKSNPHPLETDSDADASLPKPRITVFSVTDSAHPDGYVRYKLTDRNGGGCNHHDKNSGNNTSSTSTIFKAVCKYDADLKAQPYYDEVLVTAKMPDGSIGKWLSDCSLGVTEPQADPDGDVRWIPVANLP
jgi:hypothetical protein